jgi:hypothetical protein
MGGERGQSTVEWVALLLVVALLVGALAAAGVRVPGASLARAIASKLLCATSLADSCGTGEPALIAAYGTEVGRLVRDHAPTFAFEDGSRAVPVDWRRCRDSRCGDGPEEGAVERTEAGLPVTAFVHVVDRRPEGSLYIQYWLYYADSATFRGVPVVGSMGYHHDDWESIQVRIGPDGEVDERASSHDGYNYSPSRVNWASDAGIGVVRDITEAVGARADNGWGPETRVLLVSGGSHAGNIGDDRGSRFTPAGRVHLVPLEPIAAGTAAAFAISPPWLKRVWRDPEADGTD